MLTSLYPYYICWKLERLLTPFVPLQEIAEAAKDPKAAAAWEHYHSLGQRRDVIVELKKY
jgi:hypothetical protein